MSHTLWVDAPRGVLELFACGERQARLTLPGPARVTDWRVTEQAVILRGTVGAAKLTVVYPVKADAWILRLEGLASAEETAVKIVSLRFPFRATAEGAGAVTCPVEPAVSRDWITHLKMKPFGAVCLRSDGRMSLENEREIILRAGGNILTLAAAGVFQMEGPGIDKLAEARIEGATVLVSSAAVAAPAAVRFMWRPDISPNLMNRAGLPASSFRTDNWD